MEHVQRRHELAADYMHAHQRQANTEAEDVSRKKLLAEEGCPVCNALEVQERKLESGDVSGPDGAPWGTHLGWNRDEAAQRKENDRQAAVVQKEFKLWESSLHKASAASVHARRTAARERAKEQQAVSLISEIGRGADRVP